MTSTTVLLAIVGIVPLALAGLMLAYPVAGIAITGLLLFYAGAGAFLGTFIGVDQAAAAVLVAGGLVLIAIASAVWAMFRAR